jgi:hypothetical protein
MKYRELMKCVTFARRQTRYRLITGPKIMARRTKAFFLAFVTTGKRVSRIPEMSINGA